MKITIDDKTIYSVFATDFEIVWRIEDFPYVLSYLQKMNKVVLGGDILNHKMQHVYDNWYYNVNKNIDYQANVEISLKLAADYLEKYIIKNGNCFYIVFIVDD